MVDDPVNTAPLTLFAEGTSTTGRCIMPFKDGAFEVNRPFRLYHFLGPHASTSCYYEVINSLMHRRVSVDMG